MSLGHRSQAASMLQRLHRHRIQFSSSSHHATFQESYTHLCLPQMPRQTHWRHEMSKKTTTTTYTVLHLRFKLRVPPDVLLAQSQEAATIIASVEGLIWKMWVLQKEEFE